MKREQEKEEEGGREGGRETKGEKWKGEGVPRGGWEGRKPFDLLAGWVVQCGWLDMTECMCEVNKHQSGHACVTSIQISIASAMNKAALGCLT